MIAMFITYLGHGIGKVFGLVRTALGGQLNYLRSAAATRAHGRNIRAQSAATDNDNLGFCWSKQHLIFLSGRVQCALLLAP